MMLPLEPEDGGMEPLERRINSFALTLTWGSGSWLRLEVTGGSEATQVGTGKLWGSELMQSAFKEGSSVPSDLRCRCTACSHGTALLESCGQDCG